MRRHLFDIIVLFVLVSAGCLYVAFAEPAWRSVTLRIYLFVMGALLMLAIVAAAGDAVPRRQRSDFDRVLEGGDAAERTLPELEKLQREVTLATSAAYDLHFRLLPQLREIAQARLERNGRTPGPESLGRWWDLLRPDRPVPADAFERGIAHDDLRALVSDLERI